MVRRGTTFSIVGESGCGQSTLARMVVGLQSPTAGRLRFADVTRADGARPPGCAFHPRCAKAEDQSRSARPELRPAGAVTVARHLV